MFVYKTENLQIKKKKKTAKVWQTHTAYVTVINPMYVFIKERNNLTWSILHEGQRNMYSPSVMDLILSRHLISQYRSLLIKFSCISTYAERYLPLRNQAWV